jgi:hypothetical protein
MTTLARDKRKTGHDGAARMVRSPAVAPGARGAHSIDAITMPEAPMNASPPAFPDHDLPILAAQRPDPPRRPDWASLLDDGVQPALVLGAERRLQGPR